MSLRLQITLLFGAILVATMGIAAYLGESIAARAVEEGIRERSVEVARSIASEIDISRELRETDRTRIASRLSAAVARHRGLRLAEIAIRKPGKDDVVRITFGKSGPEITFDQRDVVFSSQAQARLLATEDGRVAQADQPVNDPFGRALASGRTRSGRWRGASTPCWCACAASAASCRRRWTMPPPIWRARTGRWRS